MKEFLLFLVKKKAGGWLVADSCYLLFVCETVFKDLRCKA